MIEPATVIVHWPGKSVAACERHREGLNRIASAMGMPDPTATPVTEPTDCINCINEERKKNE